MIILDTNVLSALMQQTPDVSVVNWLDTQPAESIWLTTLTLFEAKMGLRLMPAGKRRRALEDALAQLLSEDLQHRVLPFDNEAAGAAAELAASRQRAGRPVDMRDTLIAGIAVSRRATLATRNLRHFQDLDTPVVNPWEPPTSRPAPS